MLQRQLALSAPPERLAALHARAAGWHAGTGDTTAAIRHWLAAGEPARAAELVARDWNAYLQRGRVGTARGWLDLLPEELVLADPQLSLARAWVLFDSGEFAYVERWAAAAEAADDGRALLEGGRSVAAAVTMLRATLAYVVGDLGSAARMAEEAVALEPDRESPWRAVALATFGSATYWTGGDTERAVAALEEAVSLARPGVNSLATLRSLGMLAIVSLELGRRDEAARWVERADEVRERESLEEYPTGVYGLAAKAQLLAAAGDVAGALEASERAHVLGARSGVRPYLLYALTRPGGHRRDGARRRRGARAPARGARGRRGLQRSGRARARARRCRAPPARTRRARTGGSRRPLRARARRPPAAADTTHVRGDRLGAVRLEEHRAHARPEHLPQARRGQPRRRGRRGAEGSPAVTALR